MNQFINQITKQYLKSGRNIKRLRPTKQKRGGLKTEEPKKKGTKKM